MQAHRERHLKNHETNSVSAHLECPAQAKKSEICEHYEHRKVLRRSMNMENHKILSSSINQHTDINKHHKHSTGPRIN